MNHEKVMYALQDSDGNLIGIDRDSGGYPWVPNTIQGVWMLENPEGMTGYMKSFPRRFTLVKVKVSIEKV